MKAVYATLTQIGMYPLGRAMRMLLAGRSEFMAARIKLRENDFLFSIGRARLASPHADNAVSI
jgi:hypothetical protein